MLNSTLLFFLKQKYQNYKIDYAVLNTQIKCQIQTIKLDIQIKTLSLVVQTYILEFILKALKHFKLNIWLKLKSFVECSIHNPCTGRGSNLYAFTECSDLNK